MIQALPNSPITLEARHRKNMDWWIVLALVLLMGISLTAIYGATATSKGGGMINVLRQAAYFVAGTLIMGLIASRDYTALARFYLPIYIVNALLLLVVLFFHGHAVKGAGRWIPIPLPGLDFKLQPSEFAKIGLIVTLSSYLYNLGPRIREFTTLLKTLAHVALPAALIMKQPDLGTGLVLVAIWFGIVFLAGARWTHLLLLVMVGLLLFVGVWKSGKLSQYQAERINTFINPDRDPQHNGYHVLQSQIAIGSGAVFGEGLTKGQQINGGFVPEARTDFIFSVIGEEGGFASGCVLLCVYALLLGRGLLTVAESEDHLGRLMAGGVVTLLTFHVVVNIGMTTGVVPVVGVPLPLVSFGGSAILANMIGIGLLLSIRMRRHKIMF